MAKNSEIDTCGLRHKWAGAGAAAAASSGSSRHAEGKSKDQAAAVGAAKEQHALAASPHEQLIWTAAADARACIRTTGEKANC